MGLGYMIDAQILGEILDILAAFNTRLQAGAYGDDAGEAKAIANVRALVAAQKANAPKLGMAHND